jgi:8-oxo-dGTP pyrophosphatase MutT (NUDIX family)
MSFLDHIAACNIHDARRFLPFIVSGNVVGRLRRDFARRLLSWPELFDITDSSVSLIDQGADLSQRSERLASVLEQLVKQGELRPFHGEQYAAYADGTLDPLLLIDRAMAPCFGIRAFGQHINAFVRSPDGLKMWISRRAEDRIHYPGHLDNLAAGGLPFGISLRDNLAKECWEEAGIPLELAEHAVPVGAVNYHMDTQLGFKSDTLYCYDLELPEDFTPACTDGEVQAFYLWPIDEVMRRVRNGNEFKLNCNLVIIDFLIRHGYINPDEPGYMNLLTGLHPVMPFLE